MVRCFGFLLQLKAYGHLSVVGKLVQRWLLQGGNGQIARQFHLFLHNHKYVMPLTNLVQ